MLIELRCDRARPRAWMDAFAVELGGEGAETRIVWIQAGQPPAGLGALFELERLLLRKGRPSLVDPAEHEGHKAIADPTAASEIVIDFTARPRDAASPARMYLRPCYNGVAGEDAALAAILAGELPQIEIIDEANGRTLDRGWASAEIAAGLSGHLEAVVARTLTLLRAILSGSPRLPATVRPVVGRGSPKAPLAYVTGGLAHALARRVYHLCCYAPHWLIGWRLNAGAGVWENGDLSGAPWQRLADPGHRFFADPFPVTWQGRTFVFFEDLDHRVGKGTISAIEFGARAPVGPVLPVLEEPWHLSYPFLIEDGGELWMIPESSANRDVALYRCVAFPDRWERHVTLLDGLELGDATVTRHQGLYYLFGAVRDGAGGYSDTLAIYYADRLTGPWLPHAANPVLIDRAQARPAGNMVVRDGRLWRPVQDCSQGYGAALALAEVTELSPTAFRQQVRHNIAPGPAWPGRKLHTLNRVGNLEVIDGSRIQPKWRR
jgi:hypothetical protein